MLAHPSTEEAEVEPRAFRVSRLSSSDFGEGDVLAGKYRIEAILGEGGMGIVLRATHIDLGRQVAIKVIRPELAHSEEAIARMLLEAQAAACVRSEHVARVLDFGRLESGAPYLVLEYLEGRDLMQVLRDRGRISPHVAVDFILQACAGLSEAHHAGIVHRDLKPENLFVTQRSDGSPLVKVLDFGISKRLDAKARGAARTNPTELMGSPMYMAPEQMQGSTEIDARTDIWALGVVLYELCTGESPFFAETMAAIYGRVIAVEPASPCTLNADVPEALANVIERCLSKDPSARPSSVAELAALLAPFGSADAAAYARSTVRIWCGSDELVPSSARGPRVPTALSATLAVLGNGLGGVRARRSRPRIGLVGAGLAAATVLAGTLTLRAGEPEPRQPQQAKLTAVAAATSEAPSQPAVRAAALTSPPARIAKDQASLNHAPHAVSGSMPRTPAVTAVPQKAKKAWDPASFGGRL